jgi:hypothetical protein
MAEQISSRRMAGHRSQGWEVSARNDKVSIGLDVEQTNIRFDVLKFTRYSIDDQPKPRRLSATSAAKPHFTGMQTKSARSQSLSTNNSTIYDSAIRPIAQRLDTPALIRAQHHARPARQAAPSQHENSPGTHEARRGGL